MHRFAISQNYWLNKVNCCKTFASSGRLLQRKRKVFSFSSWTTTFPPCLPEDATWLDCDKQSYKYFTDNEFVLTASAVDKTVCHNGDDNDNATKDKVSTNNSDTNSSSVVNPATQQLVGHVYNNSLEEIASVLTKAQTAFDTWQYVPVQQRQRYLFDFLHLLRQPHHKDALAYLITLENGKTLADAHGDVFRGVEVVETACQVAPHLLGNAMMGLSTHVDTYTVREPLGVCVGVTPFNFPAMIPLWMMPLAIVTGNTFVLKPSEKTPSASLYLAQLFAQECGLPANVLQVVHGNATVAQALVSGAQNDQNDTNEKTLNSSTKASTTINPVKSLSFVGSTNAGRALAQLAAKHNVRCQANLGAKNHAVVVLPTTNDQNITTLLKTTASALAGAALGAAGQRCMALSVVVIVGSQDIARQLLDQVVACAEKYKVGPGWESSTDIGPLISTDSKVRVQQIIDQAVHEGAEVLLDGRHFNVVDGKNSDDTSVVKDDNFIGPTVIQLPSVDNIAYTTEIFGPVLCVLRVDSLDEALRIVNENPFGNGASIFTESGAVARHFVRHVQAGQVGVNVPIPVPLPMFSFTGNKGSIQGDLNFYGASGVHFYTQLKTITSNWIPSGNELGGVTMPTLK